MISSNAIRQTFLDFFKSKEHAVVPSAPMVIKNDPTLMFTNAGMNQFKDYFLGNQKAASKRVADTQKCLRVSGKHNDLEEVGLDTYHHTMFEMLGNWSFGDYFKKEVIEWAWELLTKVYKMPADRLYVTVFEGDPKEKLAFDQDAYNEWKKWISEDRILHGNKKDNFWEMGDIGPCGPCSEIHIDLRSDAERKKIDGKTLVNTSDPRVIEIWNLVFMEFNRKSDGSLEQLPDKHVDTGMGFERLCMAIQGKVSNYDTDVFKPLLDAISEQCGIAYNGRMIQPGEDQIMTDVAMRVVADHIRAIAFAVADGQLPSNNKAGYVIRRILRRAVRYGYTFLKFEEPFMCRLVPVLARQLGEVFPELLSQQDFIARVIQEEENSFLRTLGNGIQRFESHSGGDISGDFAFELYDTYGFPVDLTQLLARERNLSVDMEGFNRCMDEQKKRSRAATSVDTGDWIVVSDGDETVFTGYESLQEESRVLKYRKVKSKSGEQFQLVLDTTPFYAESGGQVGDTGTLISGTETIRVTDTKKENNLIIHFCDKLPSNPKAVFKASVDTTRRSRITSNHSATHLMHAALRKVLGTHVAQKGSLVNEDVTRFDFSHFAKVTDEELARIEQIVNERIRENSPLVERRNVPVKEAMGLGAMALFGEKYGDFVRVITYGQDFSVELCGGTHVPATGQIGMFRFVSESSVAAGVRRVEAITNFKAQELVQQETDTLKKLRLMLNNPKDLVQAVTALREQNETLQNELEVLQLEKVKELKKVLVKQVKNINGINFLAAIVEVPSAQAMKNLSFEMKTDTNDLLLVLGAIIDGKPLLSVMISDNLVKEKALDAGKIIRQLAREIDGGGGGQAFYATAGGKKPEGLASAIANAVTFAAI